MSMWISCKRTKTKSDGCGNNSNAWTVYIYGPTINKKSGMHIRVCISLFLCPPKPNRVLLSGDVCGPLYTSIIKKGKTTMEKETTCDFCSKDFIGYVQIGNEFPWVCETHWDIYAD